MEERFQGSPRQSRPGHPAASQARITHRLSGLLVSLLFVCTTAQAVTLGQVKVVSYLNQPLEAEIALVGLEPGQHEDLRLRIANQAQFDRLGIPFTFFMNDLKFDVVQSSGQWIVRLRSGKPVTEPFLEFPVQMTWPGGQMVRQYTLLLDPLTLKRPATVTRSARPTPRPVAAPAPSARLASSATYGPVRSGETLWPIARKLKPGGITTKQMAMALLRANPQAFIDNNINKLRAGAVLTVPPLGVIEQLDAATASRQFAEQTRQWQAPVATSPRQAAVSAPPAAPAAPQTAEATPAEQIPPPVATPAPDASASTTPDDRLRIVTDEKAAEDSGDEEAIKQQLLVTMEEIESNRITTGEIQSRLARMEQELSDMQALVTLKDQQIAALQSEISARDEIQKAAEAAEPTLPAAKPAPTPPATADVAEAVAPPRAAEPPAPEAPVTLDAAPLPAAEAPRAPWYDQYLWLIWALLGVIGLVAVALMIRRQAGVQRDSNVPMADLPSTPPTPVYPSTREPAREEIQRAERDFRSLTEEPTRPIEPPAPTAAPLPVMEKSEADAVDQRIEGMTNSMLDEMLDGGKGLEQRPGAKPNVDFSDEDIASWVEELGSEIDQLEAAAGVATGDEPKPVQAPESPIDDDIPSLLNELDDQLTSTDRTVSTETTNIQLDPLDEVSADGPLTGGQEASLEDDTFHMSLDLARAYLEIGDQEGARDMLKQALSGSRDPEHQRQIEDLLRQIP